MIPPLEELLEELGIKLGRSTDDEVYGLCPGHKEMLGREDRNPTTWSVSRHTGAHYCFSCEYGGTLVDLIQSLSKASLWDALGVLNEYGIDPYPDAELPESYHQKPRRRIEAAKTFNESRLDQFEPVPKRIARDREVSTASCAHYGVLWDEENECWITPIRHGPGGRLVGWQAKSDRFFENYPPEVPKSMTLFGLHKFEVNTTAILVESPLDVVKLHTEGFEGGLSSYGVAVSDEQMQLILSMTDTLILALDNDEAGVRWTRRLLTGERGPKRAKAVAWATRMNVFVFNYKRAKVKDPGEMTGDQIEWGLTNAIHSTEYVG